MKSVFLAVLGGSLLLAAVPAQAAKVDYESAGTLSIEANNEPLASVLRSVAQAMHIRVSVPDHLNDAISCRIHHQSVQRAFEILLGDRNYALKWKDGGQHLTDVVILANDQQSNGQESNVIQQDLPQTHNDMKLQRVGGTPRAMDTGASDTNQESAGSAEEDATDAEIAADQAKMEAEMARQNEKMKKQMAADEEKMKKQMAEDAKRM